MTRVGNRTVRIGACLSLTGRFARFGVQAGHGLAAWRLLDGNADLVIEDDGSDPHQVASCLRSLSNRCDLLLGPYSTLLMRAASGEAADLSTIVWNHGGSGDDVQVASRRCVVSVLSPTSRYSLPFLRYVSGRAPRGVMCLAEGRGSFGRQVIQGAEKAAGALGLRTLRVGPGDALPEHNAPAGWGLFCAGTFEDDVSRVNEALDLPEPPHRICAVAAGVREFSQAVTRHHAVFGIAQWFSGSHAEAQLGPEEAEFLRTYARLASSAADYPAVQAAATAALAVHCARRADSLDRDALWAVAAELHTTTMFGPFQIDAATGAQLAHDTVLVRWTDHSLLAVERASR